MLITISTWESILYFKTRSRVGDGAPMVLVELVEMKEKEKKKGQKAKVKEEEKQAKAAS